MSEQSEPPTEFLDKMRGLLGDEFTAFAASFDEPHRVGLRLNTLKTSVPDFSSKPVFALSSVGLHEPAGFLLADPAAQPGKHPFHDAGVYYLQEPAAMVVGSVVDPQPGEWVLDLAAAPGGKSTHLAARLGDTGLLVANDIDHSRAQILAQNMERWGSRHALLTNATPSQLADQFGAIFDRVLVDAPCSGEGLFRRMGSFAWSEANVTACAVRQSHILDDAARLLRPGGRLVYATCTFSPEENEGVIARFLADHPNFALEPIPPIAGAAPGQPAWVNSDLPLDRALRLWPHRFPGEGHFIARLQRQGGGGVDYALFQPRASREARALWADFAANELGDFVYEEERLHEANGRLYLIPPDAPATGSVRLVRYGLLLGEPRRSHFRPAHTLALALKPHEHGQRPILLLTILNLLATRW
ncbi:MAG: RsmF rRNA methyltransferase first C-terminal domain-containing protein [Ardenticatenaceae bacterium]|nr:RsmF rRNA methyltransferase first C-terminal domain-containing protein [Ardenticatenaceae bacterium]